LEVIILEHLFIFIGVGIGNNLPAGKTWMICWAGKTGIDDWKREIERLCCRHLRLE